MIAVDGIVEAKATQRELSFTDVLDLSSAVRRSHAERNKLTALDRDFEKRVAAGILKDEAPFRKAVFSWLLGRLDEAATAMNRRRQNPVAMLILGRISEDRGDHAEAADHYKAAADGLKNEPRARLSLAAALRRSGDLDKAASQLDRIEKRFGKGAPADVAAGIAFERGYLKEIAGEVEEALDFYEKAIETYPDHADATFRMGCIFDLRGEDARAAQCYEDSIAGGGSHVGAMINLSLLYEDRGDYERAIACYRDVLRTEPANRRAHLFLDGVIESTEEVYDELERKEQEKLDQILRMPVADFELSVRNRNVLARMSIKTLGDLVQKTEPEMLAYKNFGETSLQEIKQLLAFRGLRLGMKHDEVERRHKRERLALVMSDRDSRALSMPVGELDLSVRARRCVARQGIKTVGDLVTRTTKELLHTKNFGHTSLGEVRTKLAEMGLKLRSSEDEEEPEES